MEQRAALCLRMRAISALQIFATQRYDAVGQVQRLALFAMFAGYLLSGMSSLFSFSLELLGLLAESNCLTRNVLKKPGSVQNILESPLVQELASDHGLVDSSSHLIRRISELMQAYPEFRPTAGTESDDIVQRVIDKAAELLQSSFLECLVQNAPVRKMGREFVKGVLQSMGEQLDDAEFISFMRELVEDPEAAVRRQISRDPFMLMMMGPLMGGAGMFDGTGGTNGASDIFRQRAGVGSTGSTRSRNGVSTNDGDHAIPNAARQAPGVMPFQGEGRKLN